MAAISFDEAWGNQIIMTPLNTSPSVESEHGMVEVKSKASARHSILPSNREHKSKHKHRRKVKFVDPIDTDSSSGSDTETDIEDSDTSRIIAQLKELREENIAQSKINWTITYTSIAVIVILLVLVFHTSQKLHYTTDVLLWYLKTSHAVRQ